jgi:8-amino-3,8-dideoxy-alpha-D-manno-octulosonate transaminase
LVSSGTEALSIALAAAQIGPGDEVLVPGYCWAACFSAIVRSGAIPRLVDVDESFNMDADDLASKIGPHSKAVLLVHMNGASGDVARIAQICRARGLLLIEDNAQATGGCFQEKPLGSFGDMATFSFQYNKNMTAGEGGMVVCDDDILAKRAYAAHDQGYVRNAKGRIDTEVIQPMWGYGARISEVAAAMLYAQAQKLDTTVAAMRVHTQALYEGLARIPAVKIRQLPDPAGDSGPFVMLIWDTPEHCREMTRLTIEAGVRHNPNGGGHARLSEWGLHLYYENISLVQKAGLNPAGRPWTDPLNAFAREYDYHKGALPRLDDLIERTELFAVAPALTEERCARIIQAYHECATRLGLM